MQSYILWRYSGHFCVNVISYWVLGKSPCNNWSNRTRSESLHNGAENRLSTQLGQCRPLVPRAEWAVELSTCIPFGLPRLIWNHKNHIKVTFSAWWYMCLCWWPFSVLEVNITISNFIWSPLGVEETGSETCIFADMRENSTWGTANCSNRAQYVICENRTTDIVTGNCTYCIYISLMVAKTYAYFAIFIKCNWCSQCNVQ